MPCPQVKENVDGEEVDYTPNTLSESQYTDKFMKFNLHLMHNIATMQMYHTRGSMLRSKTRSSMRGGVGGNKQSMDELINGVRSIQELTYPTYPQCISGDSLALDSL